MRVETEDMLTVTEAGQRGMSSLVKAARAGRRVVVTQRSRPAAALVDIPTLERIQNLEDLEEDMRLLALTLARMVTTPEKRYDLDDVVAELGLDE